MTIFQLQKRTRRAKNNIRKFTQRQESEKLSPEQVNYCRFRVARAEQFLASVQKWAESRKNQTSFRCSLPNSAQRRAGIKPPVALFNAWRVEGVKYVVQTNKAGEETQFHLCQNIVELRDAVTKLIGEGEKQESLRILRVK